MIRKNILLTFFIMLIVIVKISGNDMKLNDELIQIDNEAGDFIVIWSLKKSTKFVELEDRAMDILGYAEQVITDDTLSINQRVLYIFAIQNTDFDDYKAKLKDIALEFKDGNIDEYLMRRLISPFDWDYRVIKNYKDKDIVNILDTCFSNPKISNDFYDFLTSVKSGKYWKNFKKGQRINKGFLHWLKLTFEK